MPLTHPRLMAFCICQQLVGALVVPQAVGANGSAHGAVVLSNFSGAATISDVTSHRGPWYHRLLERKHCAPLQPKEAHLDLVVAERPRPQAHHLQLPQHETDVAICTLSQSHQCAVRHLPHQVNISKRWVAACSSRHGPQHKSGLAACSGAEICCPQCQLRAAKQQWRACCCTAPAREGTALHCIGSGGSSRGGKKGKALWLQDGTFCLPYLQPLSLTDGLHALHDLILGGLPAASGTVPEPSPHVTKFCDMLHVVNPVLLLHQTMVPPQSRLSS